MTKADENMLAVRATHQLIQNLLTVEEFKIWFKDSEVGLRIQLSVAAELKIREIIRETETFVLKVKFDEPREGGYDVG